MNRPTDERHQLTVDAISDGIARVEVAGRTLEIPAAWLPDGTGEGDVVNLRVSSRDNSTSLQLELDPRATEQARSRIRSKLDQLRKRDNT
ncbi:MAG: DUF3006 domain-containing protein [Spirochaetaceae bacterium]|nr:MAG: DUF3006 domain-containing protein [Spirochaetaceae bacterium]